MIRKIIFTLIFSLLVHSPFSYAHGRWILPSHTNFSGDKLHAVALDFSISDDIFYPDFAFLSVKEASGNATLYGPPPTKLTAIYPDGSSNEIKFYNVIRKSVAGVDLDQSGTYKFQVQQPILTLTYFTNADGTYGRIFGGKSNPSLPIDATNINVTRKHSIIETYVSRNQLTFPKLSGYGLELSPQSTHPNDLFVDEPVAFQILKHNKPVKAGHTLKLTRAGTRHRNQREEIKLTTNNDGIVDITFKLAGFYLLEMEIVTPSKIDGIDEDILSLTITFEVNPT